MYNNEYTGDGNCYFYIANCARSRVIGTICSELRCERLKCWVAEQRELSRKACDLSCMSCISDDAKPYQAQI